jgi:Glycosyl hydrolase catalytic core
MMLSKNKVLGTIIKVSFLLFLGVFAHDLHGFDSMKKGVGIGACNHLSNKGLLCLKPAWFYNWTESPTGKDLPFSIPPDTVFTPMIFDTDSVDEETLNKARNYGDNLLTFNEPDNQNISVEAALKAWPILENSRMRLGSPAPSYAAEKDNSWLGSFMKKAQARGYRVNFICVHYYVKDYDNPEQATSELKLFLERVHDKYQRPVWLTEFSLGNIKKPPASALQQEAFIKRVVPMLEALPFLERYAWFSLMPWNGDGGTLKNSNLCDAKGGLNRCGHAYSGPRGLPLLIGKAK